MAMVVDEDDYDDDDCNEDDDDDDDDVRLCNTNTTKSWLVFNKIIYS